MAESETNDVQVCAACGRPNSGGGSHCRACGAELGLSHSEARGTVVMEPSEVDDEGAGGAGGRGDAS